MSDRRLRRVAARVFNRPQLISPAGAAAVVGGLSTRLGVARLREADGTLRAFQADEADREASSWDWDGPDRRADRRLFALDEETGIALVPIEGELVHRFGHLDPWSGMTGYDGIACKVTAAAEDPAVRGILLDVDSPGGEVYGCEACAEAIRAAAAAKPVWAIANELCCSAAYWLASAAASLFLPATADVGSIGVVALHADFSRALDEDGVTVTMIHSGAHKVDGNPYEPLPAPVREEFQRQSDLIYGRFVAAVARGRGLDEAAVRGTEARVFLGQEAVDAGLADAVASAEEVYREFARRLAEPATA